MKKDCINSHDNCHEWDFPDYLEDYPCKEISKTTKLCIPCSKPDIKKICKALIKISISKFEVICTPMGKKLIIEGIQYLKIVYKSKSNCENIHSTCFSMPFCTFVLLNKDCRAVIDIKSKIEYSSITPIDCKCFYLSTILFFCPIFEKEPHIHCCDSDSDSCDCGDSVYYYNCDNTIYECNNKSLEKEKTFNKCNLNNNYHNKCTDSYSCNINPGENNPFSE